MVASSELQLFVRLRYFIKDELTVATILVRCDILWLRTQSCNYSLVAIFCDRRTHGCDYFWFVAIFCGCGLGVATICSFAIFCQRRTHGCDYSGSLRYFMVADTKLRQFSVRRDVL